MNMNSTEGHFEMADRLLSRQLYWVAAADGKIAPVFAIDVAMLGVLAALVPSINRWSFCGGIAGVLSFIPLLMSIICLALAAFPRLTGPKGSLIFFSGIASRSEADYLKQMSVEINKDLTDDVLRQVYRNAGIAMQKFRFIKWGMIMMFVSMPFWLIAIWLMYPGKFGY